MRKLIAGQAMVFKLNTPESFICDECVELCMDIIRDPDEVRRRREAERLAAIALETLNKVLADLDSGESHFEGALP